MATELERLDHLLTKQERAFAKAIRDFLAVVNSAAVLEILIDMIDRGQIEDAIALVASYVNQIGDVIPTIWQDVGREAARDLAAALPGVAVGISFDVTFPRAAQLIRANRLNFIRAFTDAQRTAVRQALTRSMAEGTGTAETARAFRAAVGLSPYQEQIVANYRASLLARSSHALDYVLRDRRFDPTVERAIETDRPLTPRQVEMMVDRYRARRIAARAEDIARTEAHDAFSQAREEALQQMVEQTGIPRESVIRVWHSTRDQRTRDWHETMQGQERKLGETFEDGLGNQLRRPGDRSAPAETTINCRCTLTFRVAQAA